MSAAGGPRRCDEVEGRVTVHRQAVEVSGVDPDQRGVQPQDALQLRGGVDLDERVDPRLTGCIQAGAELVVRQGPRDQEHGAGAQRPRLPDLVRVDREILAQHRHPGAGGNPKIVVRAAEPGRLGQDGDGCGARIDIGSSEIGDRPIRDRCECAGRRGGALDLGNEREPRRVAQGGLEARGHGQGPNLPSQIAQRSDPGVVAQARARGSE